MNFILGLDNICYLAEKGDLFTTAWRWSNYIFTD